MRHRLFLFGLSGLLLLSGCKFVQDTLDPDRQNYVPPAQVEAQVKAERQTQAEKNQLQEDKKKQEDKLWSKTVAQVTQGRAANKNNPDGLPKTATDDELGMQLFSQPLKTPDPVDLTQAYERSQATMQGKVQYSQQLYQAARNDVEVGLKQIQTLTEQLRQKTEQLVKQQQDTDQKLSALDNDWKNRLTKVQQDNNEQLRVKEEENKLLRQNLVTIQQKAEVDDWRARQGWCFLAGLLLGAASYFTNGYAPLTKSAFFCFLTSVLCGVMSLACATALGLWVQVIGGIGIICYQIWTYFSTHRQNKEEDHQTQKLQTQASTMKEVYNTIEGNLGTQSSEVQAWVKTALSKGMSTTGKQLIHEWRQLDQKSKAEDSKK